MDNGGVDGRVEVITSSVSSLNGSKRDEGADDCDKDDFLSALEGPIFLTSEEGLDGPLATRDLLECLGRTDASSPIDFGRVFCAVNLRVTVVDERSRRGEMSLMVIRREKVQSTKRGLHLWWMWNDVLVGDRSKNLTRLARRLASLSRGATGRFSSNLSSSIAPLFNLSEAKC